MYGFFEACYIACFEGYCGHIPYVAIDLIFENVITCLGGSMCGCVDVMKCLYMSANVLTLMCVYLEIICMLI